MIRGMIQRGFWLKIGLPALIIFTALAALIMLPALIAGGSSQSTNNDETAGLAGTGISDAVPEEYREIVMKAGGICEDITPALIAAQIDAESGWNPDATSPAGATGLSQFMPATWAGKGIDGDGDGSADITNPIDSIWSQGNYMCELRQGVLAMSSNGALTGTTVDLTLAAYNAGLGNVQAFFGIPPFTETQNYIAKIHQLIPTYQAPAAILTASGQSSVVEAGKKYLGRPYRGEGAGGMDCCVFVQTAVGDALGIELPMFTPGQPMVVAKCEASMLNLAESYGGKQIPVSEAQPGDLIFFQSSSILPTVDYVTHVGIYAGDGKVLDSSPGIGVAIHDLSRYAKSDPMLDTAVRLPGSN